MTKEKDSQLSFEEAMQQLEALVDSMEQEPLSLENALEKFQHGVTLTRFCQTALTKAEQEIKILTSQGEKNFDVE
ncbi:MAG TPA: exodeoxyribonuclease VII small subunit [Thiotrichaceae bacterium]|nr:exodeoxyribonuclease VII small subunit [Thiotrichaceae bacterium]